MNIQQQAKIFVLCSTFLAQPVPLCAQANEQAAPTAAPQGTPCDIDGCGKALAIIEFLGEYGKYKIMWESYKYNYDENKESCKYFKDADWECYCIPHPAEENNKKCIESNENLTAAIKYAGDQVHEYLLLTKSKSDYTSANAVEKSKLWSGAQKKLEKKLEQLKKSDREKELAKAKVKTESERHEEMKKEFERWHQLMD